MQSSRAPLIRANSNERVVDFGRLSAAHASRIRTRSVKNALDLVVLSSLKEGTSLTGYGVISLVHENFGILLGPGTIYPILQHLEKRGLVISSITGRKRIYRQTRLCQEILVSVMQSFQDVQGRILEYLSNQGRGVP